MDQLLFRFVGSPECAPVTTLKNRNRLQLGPSVWLGEEHSSNAGAYIGHMERDWEDGIAHGWLLSSKYVQPHNLGVYPRRFHTLPEAESWLNNNGDDLRAIVIERCLQRNV